MLPEASGFEVFFPYPHAQSIFGKYTVDTQMVRSTDYAHTRAEGIHILSKAISYIQQWVLAIR